MPSAIELVMRCASADAELTPALGALEEACGRRLLGGMPSAPRGIDLVFRCASADHEFSELAGLKNLRDAAIASGTTRVSTPGGGAFVAQSALEFVLSQADDGVLDGLRALVSADAPHGGASDFPMPSRPGTHESDSRQRDMEPGYRLPALSGSKPQTPTLQRQRLPSDDESLSGALPPITVYESAKRPGSRQYQYRPKPTGEGLARVLACAARASECPFGLLALHGAVVAIKRKQPHRLVKIPVGGVWQVQTSLPALVQPKKVAEHVDAAAMSGPASDSQPAKGTVGHGRLSTARRIDRKLEELRIQVSHLNEVRTVRHSHNARLMARTGSPSASGKAGLSSTLCGTLSATGGASHASGADALSGTTTSRSGGNRGNLRGTTRRVASPNVSVSALGGTIGGPSTMPPVSVVDAIIASRNGTTASKSRGHRATGPMDVAPPSDPPPLNRAPIVPHRGLRAASSQKAIPRQPALHETLL